MLGSRDPQGSLFEAQAWPHGVPARSFYARMGAMSIVDLLSGGCSAAAGTPAPLNRSSARLPPIAAGQGRLTDSNTCC
jgi:hypothetical protein